MLVQIERKIANLTSEQLLNLSRLDDVEEEDEDEVSTPEAEPVAVAITVLYSSLFIYEDIGGDLTICDFVDHDR